MTDDPTIKVVLDPSAIVAYAHGSIDVGELLAEITDESARFGVPEVCLHEAGMALDVEDWTKVDILLDHTCCESLGSPLGWKDVAAMGRQLGGISRAVSIIWAADLRAYLLTAEPEAYGTAEMIIEVTDPGMAR